MTVNLTLTSPEGPSLIVLLLQIAAVLLVIVKHRTNGIYKTFVESTRSIAGYCESHAGYCELQTAKVCQRTVELQLLRVQPQPTELAGWAW